MNDSDLLDALRSPNAADVLGCPEVAAVLVETNRPRPDDLPELLEAASTLPCVLVGIADDGAAPLSDLFDVVLAPDDPALSALVATVDATPRAAASLAVLLRGAEHRTIGEGLAAESAVYSTLQAGPEFATWRDANPVPNRPPEESPAVRVDRDGSALTITLSRPHVRNAYNARMRDELLEALAIAAGDPTVREVVLAGDGPSFCSGGDLDEFGTRPDPATAHLVRLTRNAGRVLASMADRVVARIHGACVGSGIELPAFAGRVVARADTVISLPEVAMGLVPGAGGTVSLTRRVGRQRTAYLALTGTRLDVEIACAWGLVDEILEPANEPDNEPANKEDTVR